MRIRFLMESSIYSMGHGVYGTHADGVNVPSELGTYEFLLFPKKLI